MRPRPTLLAVLPRTPARTEGGEALPRSGVEPSDRLDPRLVTLNGDDRPRAPYSCGACLRPAQGRWVP